MSDLILFWHRRDLRMADNVGLTAARDQSPKVIGVFCLDPSILEKDDVAPARVTYMIGCLESLQQSYREAGSRLLILNGQPRQAIPALATALNAKAVFWNWDVEPYAQIRDKEVLEALREHAIGTHTSWDQLMHRPGEVITKSSSKPYTVFTPFWRNWQSQQKADPLQTLQDADDITHEERLAAEAGGAIALPSAKDLGFVWNQELPLGPGERVAQDRLAEFCDRAIFDYGEQRDLPAIDGTSRLSAAHKFGAIGIRTVWQAAEAVYNECRSDEARNNVRTWQQELAWREFYQHVMYFFPDLADGPYRQEFKEFPWEDNQDHFQAWCEGKTGYPIVDAAMRQLNTIGWMHNRCRMIVASFLTKDLLIDWQWGEKYFMQKLYDGDLSANNGGWQWSASCGVDPKPLRIFNPASQAQKYDSEAEYIRCWLPELSSVDTEHLVTGKIPADERDHCGYPPPIVEHKQQQREFKQRYQEQK
ncbi:MAG: FAD-binding domain-containing protein [Cyanophyceae cyanobacterium]